MSTRIDEFRLTFLWTETVVAQFGNGVEDDHPASFLKRDTSFQRAFPKMASSDSNALGLSHPWPHPGGQKFWTYYLDGTPLGKLDGKTALRALVPLRRQVAWKVEADWFNADTTVSIECFVYPHGNVVAVTFKHSEPVDTGKFAAFIMNLRRMAYDVVDDNGNTSKANVNVLAERIIDKMRSDLFGEMTPASRRASSPFTVFSVIRATGIDSTVAFPPDPAVQRILDLAAAWRPTYDVDELAPIETVKIVTRKTPVSHILYGRRRGRAIWFPALFNKANVRTVGCYHRNMVFAAAQTESLGQLVTETVSMYEGSSVIHPYHQRLCRWACGLLGRMYAGAPSTYRSNSIKEHIHDNFAGNLEKMRSVYGMTSTTF